MRVVTAAQMREADALAGERLGTGELMRRAGVAVAEAIPQWAPGARTVTAFAGPGNNGGDAFAALAELPADWTRTVYTVPAPRPSPARMGAERRARASGVNVADLPADAGEAARLLAGADVAVDALLGTGARLDSLADIVPALVALNGCGAPLLAIDVPTGLNATTGAVAKNAVRANATVTLGALKLGLLLEPGRSHTGTLYLGDIGITTLELDTAAGDRYYAFDDREFVAALPVRASDADKRSAGAPLVVAGSAQFPGAAILCARGAARAGAGYVTVATPAGADSPLRMHLVEQVVVTFDDSDVPRAIETLLDLTGHASSVALGPGLGLSDATGEIVRGFIARLELPFVADASALFHLSKHLDVLRGKACVITPHAREFARLSGEGTLAESDRIERLRSFVARTGVTTLLKGSATLISGGNAVHVNVTGTPALATAGTGDTLTGMVATLLGQGLAPIDAARVAAHWHGLGARAAARARPSGVIASDVAESLGAALLSASPHAYKSGEVLFRIA